jgi:Ca2+-binding RTX toxin-like protein
MPTNYVCGTSAADTIHGLGEHDPGLAYDEIFFGNGGADIIYAGGGNDWVWAAPGDVSDVIFFGQDGDDVLVGFDGDDWLQGDTGNDVLIGGAGNDALLGGSGDDSLWGDAGDDNLQGGDGNDLLVGDLEGQTGNDWLWGGAGDDVLIGGNGDDALNGEDGADQLWGGAGSNQMNGGAGMDTLVGGDGDDFLVGGLADGVRDILIGGAGADEFSTDGVRNYVTQGDLFTSATLATVDWAWNFNFDEGDKIKFSPEDMATPSSVGAGFHVFDDVSGTLIVADSRLFSISPLTAVFEADVSLFLPGVSLTTQELLDHGALIFS